MEILRRPLEKVKRGNFCWVALLGIVWWMLYYGDVYFLLGAKKTTQTIMSLALLGVLIQGVKTIGFLLVSEAVSVKVKCKIVTKREWFLLYAAATVYTVGLIIILLVLMSACKGSFAGEIWMAAVFVHEGLIGVYAYLQGGQTAGMVAIGSSLGVAVMWKVFMFFAPHFTETVVVGISKLF